MQNLARICRGVAVFALLAAMVVPAYAQGDARFSGTVLDQSGAFVPGATVTVKNQKTGEVRTAVSSAEGRYVVPNLKPSVYTVSVMFGAFQPLEYTDMTLAAGQEFSIDLQLQPAGVSETVTVSVTPAGWRFRSMLNSCPAASVMSVYSSGWKAPNITLIV